MLHKIALVDDDQNILTSVSMALEAEGYDVSTYPDGVAALAGIGAHPVDLAVLDIKMPRMDGMELLGEIRKTETLPVIFLTSLADETDEALGLRMGADDYITKPIKPRALMSRIAALFRRDSKKEKEKSHIIIRNLNIDRSSYTIDKAGKTITLPKKEFELLYFLANNPNVVFSRDELLHNIWGSDVFVLARTVDVHIRKVREKIGEEYITTVKGVGYKFELG